MKIPEKFIERYSSMAGKGFVESLSKKLPVSFRVNRMKSSPEAVMEKFGEYGIEIQQKAWCEDAFIAARPVSTTLEYFMGHIYIQELASMLPPLVAADELEGAKTILDACAAPGSKATQIAAMTNGVLVANDVDFSRVRALKFNFEKAGATNTIITNMDLRRFNASNNFDVIFLDAPCSAEGTSRKNRAAMEIWSETRIKRHENLQKQLILKAFDLLAEGGTLIYSTCTFAPEENEGVLDYLLKRKDARIEPIKIKNLSMSNGIMKWHGKEFDESVNKTARIWPQLNDTAGFFLAKVRK